MPSPPPEGQTPWNRWPFPRFLYVFLTDPQKDWDGPEGTGQLKTARFPFSHHSLPHQVTDSQLWLQQAGTGAHQQVALWQMLSHSGRNSRAGSWEAGLNC